MSSWTQKKMLATVGVVTFTLSGLACGGVYYAQGQIEEVEANVTAKQLEVAAANAKIAKIPSLEREVVILREGLDEYVKILPDNSQLEEFLRMVNRFDNQSGVRGLGLQKKPAKILRRGQKQGKFTPIEYTYEMTATLWQGLRFMNLIENFERFVSITEFSIEPGESSAGVVETIEGEAVHKIKITMQTYQYNRPGKADDVEIANYDERKQELRDEIWKRTQAIRVDRYEHLGQNGRRDIFVDPRETGAQGDDGPTKKEQKSALDRGIAAVESLAKITERLASEEITLFEQFTLEKRLKSELAEALARVEVDGPTIRYLPYRTRWNQEVMQPLAEVQKAREVATPTEVVDPYLPSEEIQALIAAMTQCCNEGMLEQARDRYESVRDQLSVPQSDERYGLAVEAKGWHIKATTALDFKALDLDVQGVIVNGVGTSGVLLNGEVFEEGEFVQDDLLVKMVEEEKVWFVFRGLTLVRTM